MEEGEILFRIRGCETLRRWLRAAAQAHDPPASKGRIDDPN